MYGNKNWSDNKDNFSLNVTIGLFYLNAHRRVIFGFLLVTRRPGYGSLAPFCCTSLTLSQCLPTCGCVSCPAASARCCWGCVGSVGSATCPPHPCRTAACVCRTQSAWLARRCDGRDVDGSCSAAQQAPWAARKCGSWGLVTVEAGRQIEFVTTAI